MSGAASSAAASRSASATTAPARPPGGCARPTAPRRAPGSRSSAAGVAERRFRYTGSVTRASQEGARFSLTPEAPSSLHPGQFMHRRVLLILLTILTLAAPSLSAQTTAPRSPTPQSRAAATITAGDVARRIGIIADDSMLGRDTPSRGLELTARYVGSQFRRFGLRPGGDDGTWLQRYSIKRRRFDAASSRVVLAAGGAEAVARFDRSARYVQGAVPGTPLTGPAVVVAGNLRPDDVSRMPLKDKIVLYVSDFRAPPSELAA